MNELDSQKIALVMRRLGYALVQDMDKASVILFNTCTIREKAYQKALSDIGRTEVIKKARPYVIIGVCGCVAQQEKNSIMSRFPHVDIVFGPDKILQFPYLVEKALAGQKAVDVELVNDPSNYTFADDTPDTVPGSAVAFVSIMKGCNCSCSYCIVPKVRGKEICRPADSILGEIRRLVETGTKEVVLLGQNVNSYKGFAPLLRRVANETDILRIRFTSPHPKDVGEDLINEFAENAKLCPHIHLPMQSGSDSVLRAMRRGYTSEKYISICNALKSVNSKIQITTDIIVGFCGETDSDFNDTLDVMNSVGFDSSFSFKYSPRPGTFACANMQDDVPEEVKAQRLSELQHLQSEISKRKRKSAIDKEFSALVYESDKMGKGYLTGRLPDNRIVHFAGENSKIGDILRVKIRKANKNSFWGEVVR